MQFSAVQGLPGKWCSGWRYGVVLAALLVGLVRGAIIGIGYPAASTAAIYFLMLLVLLLRPRGLLGERIQRFE